MGESTSNECWETMGNARPKVNVGGQGKKRGFPEISEDEGLEVTSDMLEHREKRLRCGECL
jgi:hypothetical protein